MTLIADTCIAIRMEIHDKAYSDAIHACGLIRHKTDDPAVSELINGLMANIDTLYKRIEDLEEMQDRDNYRKFKTNNESLCGEDDSGEAQAGDAGGDAGDNAPVADASSGAAAPGEGSDPEETGEETEEEIALKKAELEEYRRKEREARRALAELVRKTGRALNAKGLRTVEHRTEIPDWLVCPLCGGELARAGEYVTYVLSIIAAELILVKNIIGKYTCKRCGFSTDGSREGGSAGMAVRPEQAGACSSDGSPSAQADSAALGGAAGEGSAGAGMESKAGAVEAGTGGTPEEGPPGDGAGMESKAEDGSGSQPASKAGGSGPEVLELPDEERAPEVSPAFAELLRQHGCYPCPPWLRPVFAPGRRGFNAIHWPGVAAAPHCCADAWLTAHVVSYKYAFGIPLYRQESMSALEGRRLPRSSMDHWLLVKAKELEPLHSLALRDLRRCGCLNGDETTIQTLREPGRPDTAKSFFWTFLSCGAGDPRIRYVEYAPTRASSVPLAILAGFSGFLQADGYPGYLVLERSGQVVLVGCLSHVRRRFVEIVHGMERGKRREGRAYPILDMIRSIFMIERQLRKLDLEPKEFLKRREELVLPILDDLHVMIENVQKSTNPGGLLGKACAYAINQWDHVASYLKHPDLTPSNNVAERECIKPIVIGRKNYLFCGSVEGANAAGLYYTLILSAIENELDPERYLATVFIRSRLLPKERWEELLPWRIRSLEEKPDYLKRHDF